jgi:hypothetical protein
MCKVCLCSTFQVIASVSTGKRKALDAAVEFEIIQACESGKMSSSESGRYYNVTPLVLDAGPSATTAHA